MTSDIELTQTSPALKRHVGLWGAVMMGLGSIVGTGIFVSLGLAAGIAGPAVLIAIALAALVAMCNALSSAQLAASHPVSGGTYEYGYKYLHPTLGFTAGWMFLCAKSASAATAALGFSGYLLHLLNVNDARWVMPIAVVTAIVFTFIVLGGISRSNRANIVIVTVTLVVLGLLVAAGVWAWGREGSSGHFSPFFGTGGLGNTSDEGSALTEAATDFNSFTNMKALLYASALMFVAYTGYGRIATLGEEVHEPRRTIPRAIIVTLVVSAVLYMSVGVVAIALVGSDALGQAAVASAAPLELVAQRIGLPALPVLVSIGAMTAMLGVLLNLILGLSRVVLAMGRRNDLPKVTARVKEKTSSPNIAVILVGVIVAGLAATGSIKTTWSFSAFTVLIYYAITNLSAIRLPAEDRLYWRAIPWLGLSACVFLAFWVDWQIWLTGLALIALGLVWHVWRQRGQSQKV